MLKQLSMFFFPVALLGSPAGGIQNSLAPGTGQAAAPSLSNPNPIDPSSMQRAYAALGLPYGNQPQAPLQPQVQGQQPAQSQPHQPMRTMNALGRWRTGYLSSSTKGLAVWFGGLCVRLAPGHAEAHATRDCCGRASQAASGEWRVLQEGSGEGEAGKMLVCEWMGGTCARVKSEWLEGPLLEPGQLVACWAISV